MDTLTTTTSTTTRNLTPAKAVALALIAIVVCTLAVLRLGTGSSHVKVPAGARAGELTLDSCHYATEDGNDAADCGNLVVPENRADPNSRLIAVPVTRIHAHTAGKGEPIFRLEGGPGLTNMNFADASRFAVGHDVVLVGYRGVDGSSVLDCPEVVSALKHSNDLLSEKALNAKFDAYKACATRLSHEGVDLAGYTLAERVDDLEAARLALGYNRINLISESAGTRTAMIYTWRHPNSIHRSVMIGVNPPGHFVWDARVTDAQIGDFADLCAKDASCHRRTADLTGSITKTVGDLPDHWWFMPIKEGNVRLASFFGLMDSSPAAAPLSAPMTLDSLQAAAHGDASGLWLMSLAAGVTFPTAEVWGDVAAVSRADEQAARAHFASDRHDGSILGDPGSTFLWSDGRLVDAWPASPSDNEYSTMRTSNVETLVIGGALDVATPSQNATNEVMPYLPNGHQVVLQGFGHTTDFWTQQDDASSRLVNSFFNSGKVDTSLYQLQRVEFDPPVTQTMIAKIVAGTLMLMSLCMVVSLALMGRRIHRRDHFGRTASAVLRSVYPVILGVGGWFLGILIVLTTLPTIPIDGVVLAVLSTGIPIGLGVYFGWVHRHWSQQTKWIGFAAALLGAVSGAWLGFYATVGMLSVVTAIAGAIAGSNLMLILHDIVRHGTVEPEIEVPVGPQREFLAVG